jgi:prophage regulatory protein
MASPLFMNSTELEALTGIPGSTFRYWATQQPDKGPPSFKLGKRRVWRRTAVEAWLEAQENAEQENAEATSAG